LIDSFILLSIIALNDYTIMVMV